MVEIRTGSVYRVPAQEVRLGGGGSAFVEVAAHFYSMVFVAHAYQIERDYGEEIP